MTVTLLAPEVIIGKAFSDAWSAWYHGKWLKRVAQKDGIHWTTAHTFYADMGGFALEFDSYADENTEHQDTPARPDIEIITQEAIKAQPAITKMIRKLSHHFNDGNLESKGYGETTDVRTLSIRKSMQRWFDAFPGRQMEKLKRHGHLYWEQDPQYTAMAEELLSECQSIIGTSGSIPGTNWQAEYADDTINCQDYAVNLAVLQGKTWVLCARQILRARELGVIDKLPNLRDAALADKGKSDVFVKGLAFIQIVWLIIQLSSRWKYGKPCSQLEIMTLAFAVSSIHLQILHWSRPQDVMTPTVLRATRVTKDQMESIARLGPEYSFFARRLYTLPNHSNFIFPFLGGGLYGAILFGAFHLIAWDFVFPTAIERVLWKLSTFITIFCPIGWFIVAFLTQDLGRSLSNARLRKAIGYLQFEVLNGVAVVFFVVARIFLLVESFRTLYFLPPDAFSSTWAANIPHIS
jgi:hypothetical protein